MAPTRSVVLATLLAAAPLPSSATDPGPADGDPAIIVPGLACPGCEGEWNCLGHAWQRCASGRWTAVRPLACGTACAPAGRSYDFAIVPDQDGPATVCSLATATTTTTPSSSTNGSYTSITSSSSTSSPSPSSSGVPNGFTSGSAATPLGPASLAQNGRRRTAAAVAGIGAAAVVFARLLM